MRRNLISFRRSGIPEAPPSEYDAGNGAAMRVLPVALASLAWDEEEVRTAVRAQSHVTHNNAVSDAACELIVLSVRDFLRGEPLRQIYRRHARGRPLRHGGDSATLANWLRALNPAVHRECREQARALVHGADRAME